METIIMDEYHPLYFSWSEFDQHGLPGSGERYMDRDFVRRLDALRHTCGFPLVVSSGYRSPEYNNRISSTGTNGPHTTGKAADILVYGERAVMVLAKAIELGFRGIGVSQKGNFKTRFIHLDLVGGAGAPFRLWSY